MTWTGCMRWAGLTLILAAIGCSAAGPQLAPRHSESGINTSFRYSDMSYPEYIGHMKHVIEEARTDLTPSQKDTIITWNSPFIRVPDPAKCPAKNGHFHDGILLIHGLTDSPFHMWDLATHFQEKCFLVYGLLLPGHGTVPGDLLSVTYDDWVKAAQFGIARLRPNVDRLFVGGFSTGGSLAVYAALTDDQLSGLFLFAPALALKNKQVFMAGTVDTFSEGTGKWLDIAPDGDPAKYESFPLNAADQIWKLTRELATMRMHHQVSVPVFVALSADDMTVDSGETIEFFKGLSDKRSRMLLYSRKPEGQDDARIIGVTSVYPADHVLNMAHLSLTNSPENAHYGRKGDYRNCLHYLHDAKSWEECKHSNVPLGEVNPEILKEQVIRRLTYNPDFSHMTWEIDRFLDDLK